MTHEPTVHVIDDDDAARESLSFLLEVSKFSVRSYASASTFLENAHNVEPGCVITDMRMPEIDGLELLRRMAERRLLIPVIVVTGHGDVPLALEAIKAGAVDFIEKPFSDEALLGAVQLALSDFTMDGTQAAEIKDRIATLSPIEQQVLKRLTAGLSNKDIASELQVDLPSVEIHRVTIMTRMRARSLPHLVRMTFPLNR